MKKESAMIAVVLLVAAIAIYFLYNFTGMAISTTYHSTPYGQGINAPLPRSYQQVQYPYPGPTMQFPGPPEIRVLSTRFPAFVILGTASIGDLASCKSDLVWNARITSPSSRFDCFAVPLTPSYPPQPYNPWGTHGMKSDAFCYAGTTGAEGQGIDSERAVTQHIIDSLVGSGQPPWTKITFVNGLGERREVPVCGVSLEPLFARYG